ncbi:hypothetical protein BT63DRAFT_437770 [Microthyrium microscopicum]|uniref:Zn(2)-C6 fungal-type domain-containing protein n=1 Tax=Microthyrium microscopicum TaxID=703497 RepID=A0A6A6UI15_9PEZI|nr:hypothetical protein BT63DRAFT_437770 [Microthyrium microscopicum]
MTEQDPKRRKVSLACVECRERKRKCDGTRPVCGGCARRTPQPSCVYSDDTLKRGSSSYVDSLRARIKELEASAHSEPPIVPPSPPISEITRIVQSVSGQSDNFSARQLAERSKTYEAGSAGASGPSSASPKKRYMTSTSSNQVRYESQDTSSLCLDEDLEGGCSVAEDEGCIGMGVMGTLSGSVCHECKGLRGGQRSDYSGPSNVVDFDRQIRYWTTRPTEYQYSTVTRETTPRICHCAPTPTTISVPLETELSLPPRATADILVESYFERVHSLYPYLHQPTFIEAYTQLWQPALLETSNNTRRINNRLSHCLLNAVFALGSRFSPHLDALKRIATSEVFYNRAMKLLDFRLLERGSLELVQTLLLTAQYLQSTQMWGLCWNLVGLAVRVAQQIDLHISPSDIKNYPASSSALLDEEMRRRVWGGCVTLDRVLSMLYGRPQMLHPSSTRYFIDYLPSKTDEELLDQPEYQLDTQAPRIIDFYVHSLRLIHYLGDILDSLHGQETNDDLPSKQNPEEQEEQYNISGEKFQRMLKLDSCLVNWRKQIPQHIRIPYDEPRSMFWRQSQALRARYLHMRMFLLRPVLLALYRQASPSESLLDIDDSAQQSLEVDRLIRVSKICVTVTRDLINLIYTDVHHDLDLAIVWWYGVYYIYTCATIIHTARVCSSLQDCYEGKSLEESFNECLQCLHKYEAYGLAPRRCRIAMQMLEKRAFTNPVPEGHSFASQEPSFSLAQDPSFSVNDWSGIAYWYEGMNPGMPSLDIDSLFSMPFIPFDENFER